MGSSWVGVKVFVNDKFAVIPPSFDKKSIDTVRAALGTEVVPVDIISAELHGVMVAGNNNGVIFPYQVDEQQVKVIKKNYDVNVQILRSSYTALGNLILANSNYALVYKGFSGEEVRQISDALGVEVERGELGEGFATVGSLSVVTDKGLALPPMFSEDELKALEEKFRVKGDIATVNMGFQYLRLGLVANSRGALVGDLSTGTELVGIERALSFD